ncbi:PD-(D/E)XK nuclease-like domain-containing protein, partial [Saccharospirillum sp.]|uniref:PD-(D/E)XK nuclease-like domain-containing protein n=1 Tax=Saccharospirillum sp. TaxID=2033801 RepID=UPI0034A06732
IDEMTLAKDAAIREDEERAVRLGVPMAEYLADPCPEPSLTSGIAHRLITQSALHAWHAHPRLNPDYRPEQDDVLDAGSLAHALLLEGEAGLAIIEADDWRTKAAKEAREAAHEAGLIPVLARKLEPARRMAEIARAALANCGDLPMPLAAFDAEVTLQWLEPVGIWCRARADLMRKDRRVIVDYKTTGGSASPDAWIRNQMIPLGYDLQAAFYQHGNARTAGPELAQFIFCVQENYPPYAVSFVGLAPAMWDIAERKRDYAVQLWASCMKSKKWPCYPNRIAYSEPMLYQLAQAEAYTTQARDGIDEMLERATV